MHERTEGEAIESGFSHLIHFFMTIVVHSDDFDDNLGRIWLNMYEPK